MSRLAPRATDQDGQRSRFSMFALVFGFTLLGVPLIVFVALDPTTIVVTAAFALQLAACLIGVVWILRAFSDDDRPDEPQPHESEPEILSPPSRPPLRSGNQTPSIKPEPRNEALAQPQSQPACPPVTPTQPQPLVTEPGPRDELASRQPHRSPPSTRSPPRPC